MTEGVVKLRPRTKQGEQLLMQHGPMWDVLWHSPYAIALHGPGIFIRSRVDKDEQRWITQDGRPHFYARYSRGTGKSQLDSETNHGLYEE